MNKYVREPDRRGTGLQACRLRGDVRPRVTVLSSGLPTVNRAEWNQTLAGSNLAHYQTKKLLGQTLDQTLTTNFQKAIAS